MIAAFWGLVVSSGLLGAGLRQEVVSGLQRALNRSVALGSVTGDPLTGIELRDLVIAETGGFSKGVTFSADRIRITFDLVGLVLHRFDVIGSMTRVDVRTPHLVVSRNAAGAWNVVDLFAGPRASFMDFHGRLLLHDGSFTYADAQGGPVPFSTDFARVAGTVDFRRSGNVRLSLTGQGADGSEIALSGRYLSRARMIDLDLTARRAGLRQWGDYLVGIPGLHWESGRVDGRMHLLSTPSSSGSTLDYAGTLHLTDAAVEYQPLQLHLSHVSGDLRLDTEAAATTGLTMVANGAPLWVRGDVAYAGGPWLDLAVSSSGLDLTTLRAVLFPEARVGIAGEVSGDAWITGPADSPYLDGDVTAAQGRFNRQAFAALRARIESAAGILTLTGLTASLGDGRVSGDAVLNLSKESPAYLFAASAENVDATALQSLGLGTVEGLSGALSGRMAGAGDAHHVRLMAGVTMDSGVARDLAFDGLRALFWDDTGTVTLDYLSARLGPAMVHASGRLNPTGALDVAVSAVDVSLAGLDRSVDRTGMQIAGRAAIEGHLGGTTAEPVLSGTVTATGGHLGPIPFAFARGDVTLTPHAVSSQRLDLQDGAARYQISGEMVFPPHGAVHLRVDAERVDASRFAGVIPSPPITGTLSGRVSVDGPLDHSTVAGDLTLVRGTVGGKPVDRAEARFVADGPLVRVESAEAEVNSSRLNASGVVDLRGPVDLRLWAESLRLADLNVVTSLGVAPQGTLVLSGGVRGTLDAPEVWGEVTALDLLIHGRFFQASGAVNYKNGVLHFMPLDLTQGDELYRLSGDVKLSPRPVADLSLDVVDGRISTIVAASGAVLPAPVEGRIDGHVTLSGPLSDPAARLSLRLQDGRLGEYPLGTGAADLSLSHGAITIQQLQLRPPRGEIDAQGMVDLRGMSRVEASAIDLDPNILRPLLHVTQPLVGSLNVTVQFTGPTRNPTAGLSVEALDTGVPGVVADSIVALAYYKDGVLYIEDGSIAIGPHRVVLAGSLPVMQGSLALDPHGPLQLRLRLQDADLSLVSVFVRGVHDAHGTVAGEVEFGGTVGAPQMVGYVRSDGGEMRYAPLRTPITDVNVDITFSQDDIVVHDLSAILGAGRVRAQGRIAVSDFRPQKVALDLTAEHATVDVPGLYTGQVDAGLGVNGPAGRPVLSGTLTLSQGRVTYAGDLRQATASGADLGFDVAMLSGTNLKYDEGPVRADLNGALHLGGTLAQPALSGQVRSLEGTIWIFGRPFTVTEGNLLFLGEPGLAPEIHARAQALVETAHVFMEVNGPLSYPPGPVVTCSSDPPMAQEECLALVSGAGGVAGAPPGTVIGQQLGRALLGSIGQALHLDELTISYEAQTPVTLKIGKFIVHNLFVSVSQVMPRPPGGTVFTPAPGNLTPLTVTGQSYTVWGMEYFLSPSVFLSYDVDTLGDNGVFLLTRLPL